MQLDVSSLASITVQGAQPGAAAEEPAGDGYRATITRTAHGIPHVVADDFGSLGFGHGYATAETNLCNFADTLITARGERSRWFGPEGRYEDHVTFSATNLQSDALSDCFHEFSRILRFADGRGGGCDHQINPASVGQLLEPAKRCNSAVHRFF